MTMLTQAEKRRMRKTPTSLPRPVEEAAPVLVVVRRMANPQTQNIVSRIRFGSEAKTLLPHLASVWAND